MKFYRRVLSFSRAQQIALLVCLLHFCTLFGLFVHHLAARKLKPVRPLVVRTVALAPQESVRRKERGEKPLSQSKSSPSKAVSAAPAAKKKALSAPAQVPPKAAPHKKGSASLKTTSALPQKSPQPLKRPEAEVASERPRLSIPAPIVSQTEPVAPSIQESLLDPTYEETVIAFLEQSLTLPEYGEVRAKLEIDRWGRVTHFEILEAKNQKNSEFLKNRLPELTFPCLNRDTHSFTVTFRNVEIR